MVQSLIQQEIIALTNLKQLPEMAVSVMAGLSHLKYLTDTWMPPSLWHSWSQKGQIQVSVILNIPIKGVIPTTNHLESFNRLLKQKHIHHWQHAGKHLQLDLFVFLLITQILPNIFHHHSAEREYYSITGFQTDFKNKLVESTLWQNKRLLCQNPRQYQPLLFQLPGVHLKARKYTSMKLHTW